MTTRRKHKTGGTVNMGSSEALNEAETPATKGLDQPTNEASNGTSEAKVTEDVAVAQPPVDRISFSTYIERANPHRGLVASFTYEAKQSEKGLADRTEDEWKIAFDVQSKREYKAF